MAGTIPMICVKKDYDGYFTGLVLSWCKSKTTEFKSKAIILSAGPYRPDAVSCYHDHEGRLHIDFYAAIRAGFGGLSTEDVNAIMEQWL